MLAKNRDNESKEPKFQISTKEHIQIIIRLLDKYIPLFTNEIELELKENEKSMNSQLSIYLSECTKKDQSYFPYNFSKDHPNKKSKREEDIYAVIKNKKRYNPHSIDLFIKIIIKI